MRLIIRYAIDNCIKNIKSTLFNIILSLITFITVCIAIFIYDKTVYNEKKMDAFIKNGIDSTGIIHFKDIPNKENLESFYKQLGQLDEMDSYGSFYPHGLSYNCFADLVSIQNEHINKWQNGNFRAHNILDVISISESLINISDMKLYKGSIKKSKDLNKSNYYYIYLGYGFNDIPIGTKYTEKNDNQIIATYEVAGILDKQLSWFYEDIYNSEAPLTLLSDLQYEVVIISDEITTSDNLLYSVKKGKINSALNEKILDIGKANNVEIVLGSLRSIFNDYKLQNKVFYNYLRPVIIILIIVCITVMTCLQIVNSYVKISELGILYAFGIKKISYLFLFFMQNGFTTIISFIFSSFISNTFLNNMYVNETGYDSISVNDIYFPYTLPKVLLVGIIIVTASSFITYMIMRRYTAREMISNNI